MILDETFNAKRANHWTFAGYTFVFLLEVTKQILKHINGHFKVTCLVKYDSEMTRRQVNYQLVCFEALTTGTWATLKE